MSNRKDSDVLLFGKREPTADDVLAGYEADPERYDRSTPCETYWWIGQDFAHCDNCGEPCWEHTYEPGFGEYAGLRRRMTYEKRHAMWERWGKPKGIPMRVSRPCPAARNR